MTCSPSLAPDICPTADQLVRQYLMLIPRGRAWGEGGPGQLPGGIIYGFLYFCAIVMAAYHAAICALLPEFWCFSADVTAAWWLAEYGLPDPCDPYPTPCAKILASGGPTCANLVALAADLGLMIACAPGPDPASVLITVHTGSSSAASSAASSGLRLTGCYQSGQSVACATAFIAPFDCLLQRIVHAHVTIEYAYVV